MARKNPASFEKKRRERAKTQKREEKRVRRQERKAERDAGEVVYDEYLNRVDMDDAGDEGADYEDDESA